MSETDGRGELLRYVWLDDGKMVNSLLVAQGYARAAILPPDTLYGDQILKLGGPPETFGLMGFGSRRSVKNRAWFLSV